MEIAYVSQRSVKIKGKQITLLINIPDGKSKVVADGTLLVGEEKSPEFFKEETGVLLQGPGEYEIKGTKITGFKTDESVMYTVHIDGLSVFVGYVSAAARSKDKLHEHDMAVVLADDVLSEVTMGVLNANVVLFLGEKTEENAKAFGKDMQKVNKYVVTKDKLPAEKEMVFLG